MKIYILLSFISITHYSYANDNNRKSMFSEEWHEKTRDEMCEIRYKKCGNNKSCHDKHFEKMWSQLVLHFNIAALEKCQGNHDINDSNQKFNFIDIDEQNKDEENKKIFPYIMKHKKINEVSDPVILACVKKTVDNELNFIETLV